MGTLSGQNQLTDPDIWGLVGLGWHQDSGWIIQEHPHSCPWSSSVWSWLCAKDYCPARRWKFSPSLRSRTLWTPGSLIQEQKNTPASCFYTQEFRSSVNFWLLVTSLLMNLPKLRNPGGGRRVFSGLHTTWLFLFFTDVCHQLPGLTWTGACWSKSIRWTNNVMDRGWKVPKAAGQVS